MIGCDKLRRANLRKIYCRLFLISIDDKHFRINFGNIEEDGTIQFNNLPFIQIQNEQILRIALFPANGKNGGIDSLAIPSGPFPLLFWPSIGAGILPFSPFWPLCHKMSQQLAINGKREKIYCGLVSMRRTEIEGNMRNRVGSG